MKELIKHILRESSNEKFYSRTIDSMRSGKIKPPYFKYLKNIGLDRYEIIIILQKFFNGTAYTTEYGGTVENKNGKMLYHEQDGAWELKEYDERGNEIYYKLFDGFWRKIEYNKQNLETYREDSNGFWTKIQYDKYGNVIYKEYDSGVLLDER